MRLLFTAASINGLNTFTDQSLGWSVKVVVSLKNERTNFYLSKSFREGCVTLDRYKQIQWVLFIEFIALIGNLKILKHECILPV